MIDGVGAETRRSRRRRNSTAPGELLLKGDERTWLKESKLEVWRSVLKGGGM